MKQLLDPVLKFMYQVITFTVASQYWDSNQQFPFAINPKFATGNTRTVGGRAKLKKYLFSMPMASLGKKKNM